MASLFNKKYGTAQDLGYLNGWKFSSNPLQCSKKVNLGVICILLSGEKPLVSKDEASILTSNMKNQRKIGQHK